MNFRFKNFLVSVAFPLLFILFLRIVKFDGFLLYGTVFVGFIIQYFLTFWLLNFNIQPQAFITILFMPSLFFASFSVIYVGFIGKIHILPQILIIFTYLTLQYYFVSTQSILNIAQFRNISLANAANTTNNFYTVLTFFTVNMALFLVPDVSNIIRICLSFIVFIIIISIFSNLHGLDRFQLIYSIFFYFIVCIMLLNLYILDLINVDKVLLITIVLGLIFRDILVVIHYSLKRVLSAFDYAQIILELSIISYILVFLSK